LAVAIQLIWYRQREEKRVLQVQSCSFCFRLPVVLSCIIGMLMYSCAMSAGAELHSVVRVQHPRKILNTVGEKKSIALALAPPPACRRDQISTRKIGSETDVEK
jgi:hypothetical protein